MWFNHPPMATRPLAFLIASAFALAGCQSQPFSLSSVTEKIIGPRPGKTNSVQSRSILLRKEQRNVSLPSSMGRMADTPFISDRLTLEGGQVYLDTTPITSLPKGARSVYLEIKSGKGILHWDHYRQIDVATDDTASIKSDGQNFILTAKPHTVLVTPDAALLDGALLTKFPATSQQITAAINAGTLTLTSEGRKLTTKKLIP